MKSQIERLKTLMDNVGMGSMIYEVLGEDKIKGSKILSEEFEESLRDEYLYPSYADIDYENIDESSDYEIVEDLEFRYSYYDYEREDDLEKYITKIRKVLDSLSRSGTPMVIYENSNPDSYIFRVLIFKKVS